MTDISLAFLVDDGVRQVCIGCSEHLYKRGMLQVVSDHWLPNAGGGRDLVERLYRMAPGVTIAACQQAVKHRHKGPKPWGT